MSSTQSTYTINGVKVEFPCKAYPSQLSMMDKIIKGIDRQQNCLLESPTGSGKSLALLCSTLAWQAAERDKIYEENKTPIACCCCCNGELDSTVKTDVTDVQVNLTDQQMNLQEKQPADRNLSCSPTTLDLEKTANSDSDDDFQSSKKKPRSSKKTQGKIAVDLDDSTKWKMEVDKEIESKTCDCDCDKDKRTKRRLPKIYFGTRTHKQVAQIIRELRRTMYGKTRMTILSSREHTCIQPAVVKSSSRNEECKNLLDYNGCSFFDRARRVFLHPCLESGGLDTAWDIEDLLKFAKKKKACPYFGARQLRDTADIVFCPYNYLIDPTIRKSMDIVLAGHIVLLDEAHNIEDSSREAASFSLTQDQLEEAIKDLFSIASCIQKPVEHKALAEMCENLNQMIDKQKSQLDECEFDGGSKVWTGMEIVAHLELAGLNPARLKQLEGYLNKLTDKDDEKQSQARDYKMAAATNALLDGLFMVLGFIYKDNFRFINDYRVAIVKMYSYKRVATDNKWLGKQRGGNARATWTFQLNFWCMNPAVAFTDMSCKARCVILTSGTLSPMNSFQSELGVVFPIQLEANHVIGNSQVWIACISRGPSNQSLLGNYQTAETLSYQDEIGKIILQICQMVPFGVLCFMSSYKSMEKMMKRWQEVKILTRISRCKVILSEPRASDKEDFNAILQKFYSAVKQGHVKDELQEGVNGALLFAVCRGKVSEGLDFSDDNARAVITIGIPYPNVKDAQVIQKKKYNDSQSSAKGLLCGSDWYEIQAYRALNQALGRCIRHRHDWGALILLDERFGKNPQRYTSGLSKWVRQRVQFYGDFSGAMIRLKEFTENRLAANSSADESLVALESPRNTLPLTEKPQPDVSSNQSFSTISPAVGHIVFIHESSGQLPLNSSTPVASHRLLNPKRLLSNDQSQSTSSFLIPGAVQPCRDHIQITSHASQQCVTEKNDPVLLKALQQMVTPKLPMSRLFSSSQDGGFLPASLYSLSPVSSGLGSRKIEFGYVDKGMDCDLSVNNNLKQMGENTDDHVPETSSKVDGYVGNLLDIGVIKKEKMNEQENKSKFKNDVCSVLSVGIENKVAPDNLNVDYEISCLMVTDQKKTNEHEIDMERTSSPDLFDSVPTETGNEGISKVLQWIEVDSKKQEPNVCEIASKDPTCCGVSAFAQESLQLSVLPAEPSNADLEQHEYFSDDNSEFQCSQVKKRKIRNDKSFPIARIQQPSVKKMRTLSRFKARTTKNEANSENDDSFVCPADPVVQSDDVIILEATELNSSMQFSSRKSVRLRQKKTFDDFILMSKKADFTDKLDSIENEKREFGIISCHVCHVSLTLRDKILISGLTRNAVTPSFWKEAFKISESPGITLTMDQLQKDVFDCGGSESFQGFLQLNSHWSEVDGCCVQPLYCSFCKTNKASTLLAVEVKLVSAINRNNLHPGQVWLNPECLKKC